jgi:hypothetical protein
VSETAVAKKLILKGNSMRRSILTSIATLLLSGAIGTAAAPAQTTVPTVSSYPSVANQPSANQLSPFNLAYLAYQGYLEDLGIPSNGALLNAISFGKITAQDIIEAAVKANRLPEQILGDRGYRDNLEKQLQGLAEN